MTAQFGKNHLGDRDEHLPTAHGFDEFMGSLYHLNAEEEPENPDYFKDPGTDQEVRHARRDPHLGQPGRHAEDREHRPARQEAHGDDRRGGHQGVAAITWTNAKKADKPFFLWWNSTRMHIFTHLKKESEGKTGLGIYPDGMVEHDGHGRAAARQAQGTRPRRQHHRHVFHRQRRGGVHLARWRHDAVPRREGHQLGRRLPRAVRDPLARRHQARHRQQRHLRPRRHAAHAAGRRGRARREGAAPQGHESRRQDLQSPSRRLQHHRCPGRQGAQPAP